MTHTTIDVLDSTMAYSETGEGEQTVLFLHGNPTSSFIWRDIIPHVAGVARCIAPDLIGYGQSGKPDIAYRFFDQVRYLDAFLDRLSLSQRDLVIVAQDWGTALTFHYAARHPERIRGLAFMEFIHPMPTWDKFHQRQEVRDLFQAFRTPGKGEQLILQDNVFIERVIPGSVHRGLSDAEMAVYRSPFPTPESRRPVLQLPRDLPIAGEPADVYAVIERDHAALRSSTYPKLLFAGDPGALISPAYAAEFAATVPHTQLISLGAGAHYLQEDYPDTIGRSIRTWLVETVTQRAADPLSSRSATAI